MCGDSRIWSERGVHECRRVEAEVKKSGATAEVVCARNGVSSVFLFLPWSCPRGMEKGGNGEVTGRG